jgi:biofilm PGA synthesis N-glycosyltransferase PgaC
MRVILEALAERPVVTLIVTFLAIFPLFGSAMATFGALISAARRRSSHWYLPAPGAIDEARRLHPVVSVIIPAHNEEEGVVLAVERALAIDWPEVDVIVVDDGSTDGTRARVRALAEEGRIRLLHKPVNEGKSMAINDAIRLCRGELFLVLDGDGQPHPDVFNHMVPRFVAGPRVAAVTGNPRVLNTGTVLASLQAIEFSATVGVQRRGDAIWGRLMTFSGLCTLLDRDAVVSQGGFAPEMATEDIDLTWRLQLAGRHVVYEPRALFGMEAPETFGAWWRQRKRWVQGLAQVLRRHGPTALSPKQWRMWPVMGQGVFSILWAHLVLIFFVVLGLDFIFGVTVPGLSGYLRFFAALVLIAGVIQVLVGVFLDRRSDPGIIRQLIWAAWYPLVYWIFCVVTVFRATLPALIRRPKGLSTWNLERVG